MAQKSLHVTRRKMSHVIDELYTLLLRSGGDEVNLQIRRDDKGLHLRAEGNFDPVHRHEMERLKEILRPTFRNPALVEEYWELAGGDQYTSDSELALVGQMVDEAHVEIGEEWIRIQIHIKF